MKQEVWARKIDTLYPKLIRLKTLNNREIPCTEKIRENEMPYPRLPINNAKHHHVNKFLETQERNQGWIFHDVQAVLQSFWNQLCGCPGHLLLHARGLHMKSSLWNPTLWRPLLKGNAQFSEWMCKNLALNDKMYKASKNQSWNTGWELSMEYWHKYTSCKSKKVIL